ncbi:MAG TPA: hypothetical protein VGC01_01005, partial [Mucilaginibacter sp.]
IEYLTHARMVDYKDRDMTKMQGYAKPYYEKYIALDGALPTPTDTQKRGLAEAYAYLGNYYVYHDKDDAKALEAFTKARDLNPNNAQAKFYFDSKAAPAPAATPAKPAAKKP